MELKDARPAATFAWPENLGHGEVTCGSPITCELMEDPVFEKDSFTYERAAIKAHLSIHGVSPITNLPMRPTAVPNHIVKSMEWNGRSQHCLYAPIHAGYTHKAVRQLGGIKAADMFVVDLFLGA